MRPVSMPQTAEKLIIMEWCPLTTPVEDLSIALGNRILDFLSKGILEKLLYLLKIGRIVMSSPLKPR